MPTGKQRVRNYPKTSILAKSLDAVKSRYEPVNSVGQVKLSQLEEAAASVAAEYAEFETPWEQSLKLMVEAAGVSLSQPEQQNAAERAAGDRLPPLFPDDLTPSKAADCLRRRMGGGRKSPQTLKPGHDGMECFKLFTRAGFQKQIGFAFLKRKYPIGEVLSNHYDIETVPGVISSSEFWLFSNHGVLYSSADDAEFLTLAAWAEQYRKFKSLQKVKFFRNFKKIKAFHAWRQFSDGARVSLHRTLLSRNHILSEVELAQPILAVSSLFEEMKDLNFLPYLPKGWLFESFEKEKVGNISSTLCHLELADALQNLYHMVAMICSTALTRINRLVLEAQETVQKLDRAPRNKQESWHKLRKNLQVAQATLLRFERALKNHSKLVEHTKLRLQSALVEARRKQLMQIWNTINQEHLAIVNLQQSENGAELVPQIGKWEEIFRVHVSDMIPIFGLALQRAQEMDYAVTSSSPSTLSILKSFESTLPNIGADGASEALIAQITAKIHKCFGELQEFVEQKIPQHHLAARYLWNFDLEQFVENVFKNADGPAFLKQHFEDFQKWDSALDGKNHIFGMAILSSEGFCNGMKSKINSMRARIVSAIEFQMRNYISDFSSLAERLAEELAKTKNYEKIFEIANDIGKIVASRDQAVAKIKLLVDISGLIPEMNSELKSELEAIANLFSGIHKNVDDTVDGLKNPKQHVVDELKRRYIETQKKTKILLNNVMENLSKRPTLDASDGFSRSQLRFFLERYHEASQLNEVNSNVIAGIEALGYKLPYESITPQATFLTKQCYQIWSSVQSSHIKLESVKELKLAEQRKINDSYKQLQSLIEDVDDALQHLNEQLGEIQSFNPDVLFSQKEENAENEYNHITKTPFIKEQIQPFMKIVKFWECVVALVVKIISSNFREKEWNQFMSVLKLEKAYKETKIVETQIIKKEQKICNRLLAASHRAKNLQDEMDEIKKALDHDFIPVVLREVHQESEELYFDTQLEELVEQMHGYRRKANSWKVQLTWAEHLGDDDLDRLMCVEAHLIYDRICKISKELEKIYNINNIAEAILTYKLSGFDAFLDEKKKLFKLFENQYASGVLMLTDEIGKVKPPPVEKVLKKHFDEYELLKLIPQEKMIQLIPLGLNKKVLRTISSVIFAEIADFEVREVCEELKIESVLLQDQTKLNFDSLFSSKTQFFGSFFKKIEAEIINICKKNAQKAIIDLENDGTKLLDFEFWEKSSLPSMLLVLVFLKFSSETEIDDDDLKKFQKQLSESNIPRLQNLAGAISQDPTEIKLAINKENEICVNDRLIDYWPTSTSVQCYVAGVCRLAKLSDETDPLNTIRVTTIKFATCYAALRGLKLVVAKKNHPLLYTHNESYIYLDFELTNEEQNTIADIYLQNIASEQSRPMIFIREQKLNENIKIFVHRQQTCNNLRMGQIQKMTLVHKNLLSSQGLPETITKLSSALKLSYVHFAEFLERTTSLRSLMEDQDGNVECSSASDAGSTKSSLERRKEGYSRQINRMKDTEIAMALAFYLLKTSKEEKFDAISDKSKMNLISDAFPVMRVPLFERLFETTGNKFVEKIADLYAHDLMINTTQTKSLHAFVHQVLIATSQRRIVEIEDTCVTEELLGTLTDCLESGQDGVKRASSASTKGSGSSTKSQKVTKIGNNLLPQEIQLEYTNDIDQCIRDCSFKKPTWIITRDRDFREYERLPENACIILLVSVPDGITIPKFFWKAFYIQKLDYLDSTNKILYSNKLKFMQNSLKTLHHFDRYVEDIYKNEEIQDEGVFNSNNMAHWSSLNAVDRVVIVQKLFLFWAKSQGLLPEDASVDNDEILERIARLSIFWAYALGLSPTQRSTFSEQFHEAIEEEQDDDLSRVYINAEGDFEEFDAKSRIEQNVPGYVLSVELLQGKWLLGVLVPTDQTRIKSNLQLNGPAGCGKTHLISYYDIDHPKPLQTRVIPGGAESFHDRFKLFTPCQLIPDQLSKANSHRFIRSFSKPIISVAGPDQSAFEDSRTFLQYQVDFSPDIKDISFQFLYGRILWLAKNLNPRKRTHEIPIEDITELIISWIATLLHRKYLNTTMLNWQRMAAVCLGEIMGYYYRESQEGGTFTKAKWDEWFKAILIDSLIDLTRMFSRTGNPALHYGGKYLQRLKTILATIETKEFKGNRISSFAKHARSIIWEIKLQKEKKETLNIYFLTNSQVLEGHPTFEEIHPPHYIPTLHQLHLTEWMFMGSKVSNHLILCSECNYVGRKTAAKSVAKLQKLRYFEITKDAFHDQIMAAIRLDEPLLIYANSTKLSQDSWRKVMTLVTTKDIFSIIDFEDVFTALDPTGYYKEMKKVKDTTLEKIQQRWFTQMVFVLAVEPSHLPEITKHLPSSFRIKVDRWEESDWMTTAHYLIQQSDNKDDVCRIFAAYMTRVPVHFSPEYGSRLLKEYDELVKIKSKQISIELEETKAVNESIQEAHEAFNSRTLGYKDDTDRLAELVKNLEMLRKSSDDALDEYRGNFDKNLEIEQRFSHLQQIVNVLREETDLSSRVHPLFQKAQNVLKTLDIRDFEELRTYRKPPASVVLVVESICLLFNEEPTFETGTALLHKDNFFLEMEFFEKEKVTKQAFQKLRHRLERVNEREVANASKPALGLLHWLQAIVGFSTTYNEMLPVLKRLKKAESELQNVQKQLGESRVNLDRLNAIFESLENECKQESEAMFDLKAKIRKEESELKQIKQFLDDLGPFYEKWKSRQRELIEAQEKLNIQTIVSILYLFIISRWDSDERENQIRILGEICGKFKITPEEFFSSETVQWLKMDNSKSWPSQNVAIIKKYLSERKIDYCIRSWSESPTKLTNQLVLSLVQAEDEIKEEWTEIFVRKQFPKYSRECKMSEANNEMIMSEVELLEKKIFSDIKAKKTNICDLGTLRKKVAIRQRNNAQWVQVESENNSLSLIWKSQRESVSTVISAAWNSMLLLERVAGPLVPSRVKIFTEIFEKMPRLTTIDREGVDLSRKNLFYAHLLPALRSYMSEELVEKYENLLITENLSNEKISLGKNELLQILNSTSFEQLERDESDHELVETLLDSQFNPFLPSEFSSDPVELIRKVCELDGSSRRMKSILLPIALGIPGETFPHASFATPRVFISSREDRSVAPKEIVADLIASGMKKFSRKETDEDCCRLALEDPVEFENIKGSILALREEQVNHPELNRWLTCEKTLLQKKQCRQEESANEYKLCGYQKWTLKRILTNLPKSIEPKVAIFLTEMARNSESQEFYEKIVDVLKEQAAKLALDVEVAIEKNILEAFLQFAEQKLKKSCCYVSSTSPNKVDGLPIVAIPKVGRSEEYLKIVPIDSLDESSVAKKFKL